MAHLLERFNGVSSVNIQGSAAEGISSGEAMAEMQKLVEQLPPGFAIEWSGLSYEEQEAGSQAPMLYALSILIVFLCLAALYESWSVPFAVMLVVPLGILGSVTAAFIFNLPNDVYLQVAFLTTVGLAAKKRYSYCRICKRTVRKRRRFNDCGFKCSLSAFPPNSNDVNGVYFGSNAVSTS